MENLSEIRGRGGREWERRLAFDYTTTGASRVPAGEVLMAILMM